MWMSRRGRHEAYVHPGEAQAEVTRAACPGTLLEAPTSTPHHQPPPGACLLEGHQLRNRHFRHHGIVVCGKRAGRNLQA